MRRPIAKGNRGKAWEDVLELSFQQLEQSTVIRTSPRVVVERFVNRGGRSGSFFGHFIGAGPCDFEGTCQGQSIVAEAKESHKEEWDILAALTGDQAIRLMRSWEAGASAGLLLRYREPEAMFGIAWARLAYWLGNSVVKISACDLTSCAGYGEASGVVALKWDTAKLGQLHALCVDLSPWIRLAREFSKPLLRHGSQPDARWEFSNGALLEEDHPTV